MTLFLTIAAFTFAIEQPIPFSHKLHAGKLKLACAGCHLQAETDSEMGLPTESICESCHSQMPALKDSLKILRGFISERKAIPWKRVYELPTYVFWSHAPHRNANIACEKCHGPVAEREVLTREISHKMADCIACHRVNRAGTDCAFCHEQRH